MRDRPPPPADQHGDCRAPDDDIGLDALPLLEAPDGGGGGGSSTQPHEQINPYFRITKVAQMTPRMDVDTDQPRPTRKPNVTVGDTCMGPPPRKKASRKRPAPEITLECDEEFVDSPVSMSEMFDAAPLTTTTGCTLTELYDINLAEALLGDCPVVQLV